MTFMERRLEPLMQSILQEGVVGASILVQQGGRTLAESYHGYADGANRIPIGPGTLFRLHSMTKLFVCTAALMRMERGLYLLGDPLYEYMPQFRNMTVTHTDPTGCETFRPAKTPIRVRDLFTMSTGITRRDNRCAASRAASKIFLDNAGDKGLYDYRFTIQDFAREIA